MATFNSFIGKKVATHSGVVEFKTEEIEVTDKDVIASLKKAKEVYEGKTQKIEKADKK